MRTISVVLMSIVIMCSLSACGGHQEETAVQSAGGSVGTHKTVATGKTETGETDITFNKAGEDVDIQIAKGWAMDQIDEESFDIKDKKGDVVATGYINDPETYYDYEEITRGLITKKEVNPANGKSGNYFDYTEEAEEGTMYYRVIQNGDSCIILSTKAGAEEIEKAYNALKL